MTASKSVADSQVVMSQLMLPTDANPYGNVHGGSIMKLADTAGGVAAYRHARHRIVTARMDSMDFQAPVYVGNLVTLKASVNDVGRTSLEVGVRVEAEDLITGRITHVSSAYLVYVALDDAGRPCEVPALRAETPTEQRRQTEARLRREHRHRSEASIRTSRQMAPSGTHQLFRAPGQPPFITGHRGASGHAPENTMASFDLALQMGADLVEFDVHLSRDGELVVIHDHTLDRTTNGRGLVRDHTLAQLQELDAGAWFGPQFRGQRLPTLGEVLRWARGRTRVAVELKNGPVYYPGIEEKIAQSLQAEGMEGSALVISFDHFAIRRIKEINPRLATGVLYAARLIDGVAAARAALADALLPVWAYVTPETVEEAHATGIAVHTWNIDDPTLLPPLLATGVDAVGSNFPDRVRGAIGPAASQAT